VTEVRDPLADLAGLWQWFADTSCRGFSPLYERISRNIAEDRPLLGLVRRAPPAAHQPALFLATVHFLVLEGLRHPLAEVYAGASSEDPGALFRDVCLSNSERILDLMASRTVQTNEVGRSAIIAPALSWVARTIGTPLEFVDVGASAGLNLLCDEYLLDYGEFGCTGPENAEVRIDCRVAGGRPPIERRLSSIARRVGIDRDPPDLSDPADALWQLACVWPDTNRLDRTRAAISFAKRHPPTVVTATLSKCCRRFWQTWSGPHRKGWFVSRRRGSSLTSPWGREPASSSCSRTSRAIETSCGSPERARASWTW